jgi:tetratricopeptide (TPR) repeat protein
MPLRRAILAVLFASAPILANPPDWNTRGIEYFREGHLTQALHCFERARSLSPDSRIVLYNLATCRAKIAIDTVKEGTGRARFRIAEEYAAKALLGFEEEPYFHKVLGYVYQEEGRYEEARERYRIAAELAPDDPSTNSLLGNVAYHLEEYDEAMTFWERSYALDPSQKDLRTRMHKARRESALSEGFESLHDRHFRIQYDPGIHQARSEANRILDVLEVARREVGRILGHQTTKVVPVVLYSDESFQAYMGEHVWARGLYDGKIRLPDFGEEKRDALTRIATHEYVHAVIYDLTKSKCPAWLNEGLAQVLAGEWWANSEAIARGLASGAPVMPLEDLAESFLRLPETQVETAYVQAYLASEYLLDHFTKRHLHRLFQAIAAGESIDEAVRSIYHRDLEDLMNDALLAWVDESEVAARR